MYLVATSRAHDVDRFARDMVNPETLALPLTATKLSPYVKYVNHKSFGWYSESYDRTT